MDKHKRISQDQLDIWLDSPVTKAYFQCIEWSIEQIRESIGLGGWRDPDNNDHTANHLSQALGKADGMEDAINVLSHLQKHQMIEIPKEEE